MTFFYPRAKLLTLKNHNLSIRRQILMKFIFLKSCSCVLLEYINICINYYNFFHAKFLVFLQRNWFYLYIELRNIAIWLKVDKYYIFSLLYLTIPTIPISGWWFIFRSCYNTTCQHYMGRVFQNTVMFFLKWPKIAI